MNGVMFTGGDTFADTLAPLLDVMSELHWSIDIGAAPFVVPDDNEDLQRELEAFTLETPSGILYRAGVLPPFVGDLRCDEWSYYVGFAGSVADAVVASSRFNPDELGRPWRRMPPAELKLGIVCECPGRTWAVVSPEEAWLDRLRDHFACRPFDPTRLWE